MLNHPEAHPLAGKLVDCALEMPNGGKHLGNYVVEDWADRVFGKSWAMLDGNPLALDFALRIGLSPKAPVIDNEVVYAKSERTGMAALIHQSEILE